MKQFHESFWREVKKSSFASIPEAFLNHELSSPQKQAATELLEKRDKQAVIDLLEKRDRDKRHIKNWRLISLLNTDIKIISPFNKTKKCITFSNFFQSNFYILKID